MPEQNTPQLCGRVIESGPAGRCKTLDGGGCTFSVVVLWVQPEVARRLAQHVDGEVLLERVGIPGDRLTSAPHRPAPPELEPAFATRPLTPTEQLVWAAAYAQYFIGGSRPADAARHATTCTLSLRDIQPETITQRSKTDLAGEQAVAALEQMRGGR